MIYLDNAATTGRKPRRVREAVNKAIGEYAVNPGRGGYAVARSCEEQIYSCRREAADFFGSEDPASVVFTANCTAALNYVLKGILRPGDHVVVSSMEHNAVMRPLTVLQKQGVTVTVVPVDPEDPAVTVHGFEEAVTPKTSLVCCQHASNVSGHILPIEAIASICRKHKVPFLVDAAQTAGILPINMKKIGIDYLAVAAHKGLYAPSGIGLLIARSRLAKTVIEGGTGTSSALTEQPEEMPERFESGTVSVPLIFGLREGLAFVQNRTSLYRHELLLAARAYDGLAGFGGIRLCSGHPAPGYTVPTLSFRVPGMTPFACADYYDRMGIAVRSGLHCAPGAHRTLGTFPDGTVRISFSAFNTKEEIDRFLAVTEKMLRTIR